MNSAILRLGDYYLYEWGNGYKSEIDGEWMQFDTASQWAKYINYINERKNEVQQKKNHTNQRRIRRA